jgi:predicted dehydrogenase/RimJ/RimL family protein N-acetyltransferase
VAVIGQGSIGRRHAAILLDLGHEVAVYDPSPAVPSPHGVQVAASAHECLEGAAAAVVASPSSEHPAGARAAIELGVPVLVEKPLALDSAHAAELDCLSQERGVMLSVAMNLREHPGVQALAELLAADTVGRILRASAWCGSWLPGWRADSDYRQSYSARAELGGGVLLDVAVHELDYLLWLAGPARSVSALARQVSELETDVEDVALIVMELASGAVAEVAVDYFDRSYTRGCRIVGSSGSLHWSWEDQRVTCHDASGASSQRGVPSDVSPAYRRQLERFLAAAADGAPPPVPAVEARHVLAVLDAARASSRDGRRVALAPAVTLRAAHLGDADRLRAWRNDPETRRWSRTSHEIAPDEHASWLQRVLADASTRAWVAESGGSPIASVRVGPTTQGVSEVHITLAPEARGQGLGAAVLMQAAARALAEPGVTLLCAHVKPEHVASLRAFARAGFNQAGTDDGGLLRLERVPGSL